MVFPGMLTLLVILPITGLFSLLASTKAGGVKPVEAIGNAGPSPGFSEKSQLSLRGLSELPVSVMLAVKSIFSNRRQSGFLLVSVMVLAFVMTFSVNTFYSVKNMAENYAYWGFDDAHVYLSASVNTNPDANTGGSATAYSRAEIMTILNGDERVQAVLPYQVFTDVAIPAQGGHPSKNVIGFMYDGDMDTMGLLNLTGDNPKRRDEVAISYMAAQQYDKTVGDSIVLYMGGQKISCRVTGVYQCVNAMGWGIRLQEEALRKIDPATYAGNYSVKLKEEKEAGAFAEDMKALFGEGYSIRLVSESGEINLTQITGSIGLVALFLSLIFAIVAFIIIFNTNTMEIYRDKKNLCI